ncbi:MAG: hypothetical protein AAB807_00165 [Patescibacteria group bacterium]
MEDELKNLLRKNLEVSQESLRILKKINRDRIYGKIFYLLKWAVIIGATLGTYYYIEPMIKDLINTLSAVNSGIGEARNIGEGLKTNGNGLPPDLIQKLRNLLGQ